MYLCIELVRGDSGCSAGCSALRCYKFLRITAGFIENLDQTGGYILEHTVQAIKGQMKGGRRTDTGLALFTTVPPDPSIDGLVVLKVL